MKEFTLKKEGKKVAEDVVDLTLTTSSYSENVKKFDYKELNGEEKIIAFEGVRVFFGELSTEGLIDFDVSYDNPFALLSFEIEGGHGFILENTNLPILEIASDTFNCSFIPTFKGSMFYVKEKRKYVTFVFSKNYITNLLKFYFPKIGKPYLNLMSENNYFNIFSKSKEIPFAVHCILNEIINCCYEGEIKEAYLKMKITEIFVVIFTLLGTKRLSDNDFLAERTRDFVLKHYTDKITLDRIAKELTTNKTKLKSVFKNRFKTSIISFKTEIQMIEAKKLFNSKKFTVAEVAYRIGYKNPQHFSTAFKKHFDITPTEYLKKI